MTRIEPASTKSSRRGKIAKRVLESKEFRDSYALSHATSSVAFQILANRKARGWTQKELGKRADMKQGFVCRLENPDSGIPNVETLARLASAFDAALMVRFVPFSELIDWASRMDQGSLAVKSATDDPGLMEQIIDRDYTVTNVAVRSPQTTDAPRLRRVLISAQQIRTVSPADHETWQITPTTQTTPYSAEN